MKTKKIVLAVATFFVSASVFAELRKPNRYFEIGVEAEAGASNNYFSTNEFMVKDLVIDLKKIADEIPSGGWKAEVLDKEKAFINLNISERFRLGFFTGLDVSGSVNIGKELFDFLGNGFTGGSKSVKLSGHFDAFLDAGVSFRTKIREFGVTISPAYYVPLIYMPSTTATASWSSDSSGKLKANVQANVKVYSAVDMRRWTEKNDFDENANPSLNDEIQSALKNGGFDLSLAVEHPIFGQWLEVGGFARIPILPGTLDYEMSRTVSAHVSTDGFLKILTDDDELEKEFDSGTATYSKTSHKVYRPLRFGAEAAFRPFGRWFTLRPMGALVMRSPYDGDEREIFPEYSLSATASLFNVLSLTVGTAYLNQVFVHSALFALNARVLELDLGIALRGGDFLKSFQGTGTSACIGVKIGF